MVTESTSDEKTEKNTEMVTESTSDEKTEKNTEIVTESTLNEKTEKNTEIVTESTSDEKTEKNTEIVTEKATDSVLNEKTDQLTELNTESFVNENTQKNTETATDIISDKKTDAITEMITNSVSDEKTEKNSELVTDIISEKKTNAITEKDTNSLSDEKTEKNQIDNIIDGKTETNTDIISYKTNVQLTDISTAKETTNFIEEIIKSKHCEYSLSDEQLNELSMEIKDNYLNMEHKGNNTIIYLNNAIFQISTHEDQKNSDNSQVSSIDLGPCEAKLRERYGIPNKEPLIIYKVDVKYPDSHCTYVKYEVYNPVDLTLCELSICKTENIVISTPVDIDDMTSLLYDSLKSSGYNLFNENDSFYNDPCTTYTSINNTDITLSDRKQLYKNNSGNMSLCQSGCELEYYNSKTKKAKCICIPDYEVLKDLIDPSKVKFNIRVISDNFLETISNSNFIVLKCYKLAFDLSTIWTNIGRIFMAVTLLLYLIFMFYFVFKDFQNINKIIKNFLKISFNYDINFKSSNKNKNNTIIKKIPDMKKIPNIKNIKNKKTQIKTKTKTNINNKKDVKKKITEITKKSKIDNKNKKIKHVPPIKRKKIKDVNGISNTKYENSNSKIVLYEDIKKKVKSPKKKTNINIIKIHNFNIENFCKQKKNKKENIYLNNNKKKISPKKKNNKIIKSVKIPNNKKNNINNIKNKINEKESINYKNLNDYELDSLDYLDAYKIDKRTYFQYYWSLLKRKQLLLFTFCPTKDYNFLSMKITLFLITFSLYLTITGFFFDNESMHNIYIYNGVYIFLSEMPKIVVSSLITSIANIILRQLSLSEKNFLSVKNQKTLKIMVDTSKSLKQYLKIKFSLFFLVGLSCLLFCFYFMSCFCSVYPNTQLILIKSSVFSFCLSMIYPFGLNLVPGMFRIPALRSTKKNRSCIFKIGYIISLI